MVSPAWHPVPGYSMVRLVYRSLARWRKCCGRTSASFSGICHMELSSFVEMEEGWLSCNSLRRMAQGVCTSISVCCMLHMLFLAFSTGQSWAVLAPASHAVPSCSMARLVYCSLRSLVGGCVCISAFVRGMCHMLSYKEAVLARRALRPLGVRQGGVCTSHDLSCMFYMMFSSFSSGVSSVSVGRWSPS